MENIQQKKQVKILFILIDGVGDLGLNKLDGQTILQKHKYPYFDAIAETGVSGLMDPVETGLACGSDTAHMNIFGYNPFLHYQGRGSFEAMGSGMEMSGSEIGFKCNFAHMDLETKIVDKRRVDREFPTWGLPLVDTIDGMQVPGFPGYQIRAKYATEHRLGIKVQGANLTNKITGTDPLKDNLKLRECKALDKNDQDAVKTALIVNAISDEITRILKDQPINIKRREEKLIDANLILLRGCGKRLNVENFDKLQNLTKAVMIAPTAIINGLGQSIGMDCPKVEGATGDYHSDYSKKAEAAFALFEDEQKNYEFCFLHIKAVDDAGHDKSYDKKHEYCSKVDEMIKYFLKIIVDKKSNKEYVICLTGDHTTPVEVGDHTFEPVPFAVSNTEAMLKKFNPEYQPSSEQKLQLRDKVQSYDEIACGEGCLGRFVGLKAIPILKNFKKTLENL